MRYDRKHTSATDSGTWFPLPQFLNAAAGRRIGEVAPRFFGAPTNRSHRVTIDVDAPEILARCLTDAVDVAVLVPNCPVCHQTSALVARHHDAVAAALERGRLLEARLQQHRADEPGRTGAAPSRIRQAKRDRARQQSRLTRDQEQEEHHQEDVRVTRPFEGVKILDFTQVLAGPYASYQLALLGAHVIKVERREGEDIRRTPLSAEH